MKRLLNIFLLTALFLSTFSLNLRAKSSETLISLKPNITEIIFALGRGKDLVGVTQFCKRPPKAAKLEKVADYMRINLEKIIKLQPSLVLTSPENSSRKEIEALIKRGLKVELLSFKTIEETQASTLKMGKTLNRQKEAESLVKKMQEELSNLQKLQNQKPSKKVLLIVGYQPLVVVGEGNFIDESLTYLNLKNVAQGSGRAYPVWDLERVLASQAEVLIDLSMGSEKTKPKSIEQRKEFWRRLHNLPAVKKDQLIFFDIEKFRAVPALPEALEELAGLID